MMRYIPAALVTTILLAAIVAGAWGLNDSTLREGRFTVESENITESSGLLVKRLRIVANGAKGVRLTHGTGDASWLSLANTPMSEDRLQHVQLVFVADKSLDLGTENCSITWLEQITTTGGARVGGPSRHVVPRDTALDEFVQLDLPHGEYTVGESLLLGVADGRSIKVMIEGYESAQQRE